MTHRIAPLFRTGFIRSASGETMLTPVDTGNGSLGIPSCVCTPSRSNHADLAPVLGSLWDMMLSVIWSSGIARSGFSSLSVTPREKCCPYHCITRGYGAAHQPMRNPRQCFRLESWHTRDAQPLEDSMRYVLACIAFASVAIAPQMAAAQDASYYRCENKAVKLNIPTMPLGKALDRFTAATRCPVSMDAEQVAGNDPRIVPSAAVKGRMLPGKALRQMLSASPLKSRIIKGGFSVYYN